MTDALTFTIRCNSCGSHFVDDDDLGMLEEPSGEVYKGCPVCATDANLMDLGGISNGRARHIPDSDGGL